jgi:hypothetical protein
VFWCCCSNNELAIAGTIARWVPAFSSRETFGFWAYYPNNSVQQSHSGVATWVPEFGGINNVFDGFGYCVFIQQVNLAQGTTISGAVLDLFRSTSNTTNLTALPVPVGIWVWLGDNASAGIDLFNPPDPPVTPKDTWSSGNPGTWSSRINLTITGNHTVDITSHIQSVLNRPGWVSGNNIALAVVTDYTTASIDPADKTWYGNWDQSVIPTGPLTNQWVHNYVRITL